MSSRSWWVYAGVQDPGPRRKLFRIYCGRGKRAVQGADLVWCWCQMNCKDRCTKTRSNPTSSRVQPLPLPTAFVHLNSLSRGRTWTYHDCPQGTWSHRTFNLCSGRRRGKPHCHKTPQDRRKTSRCLGRPVMVAVVRSVEYMRNRDRSIW